MTISTFNQLEALFWWVVAGTIFIKSRDLDESRKRIARICGKVFILLGITELIEAEIGAWWTPLWLYIIKAGCAVTLAFCFFKYRELQNPDNEPKQ